MFSVFSAFKTCSVAFVICSFRLLAVFSKLSKLEKKQQKGIYQGLLRFCPEHVDFHSLSPLSLQSEKCP